MKIFLLLIIYISLYANSILTDYRINGMKYIEKQIDRELTNSKYWSKQIESKDTSFGYIEAYSNILICDKEKSILKLYTEDSNKKYKLQKEYIAYTGKKNGDKTKEGDLKTPVGVYNLTKKISKLDSFYGPLAFVTSYPNSYDKYKGKNGSGIWIHGLPTEEKRDEFTKGCIAINNSSIECLDKNINIKKTLLIINHKNIKRAVTKKTLTSILTSLYKWRYAWIYGDINRYLDFYASDFVRFDGMRYSKFKKYKTRIFKKTEKRIIIFNDINVIPYPNTFKEYYKSDSFAFTGGKTLMVRIDTNNKMKIFTER